MGYFTAYYFGSDGDGQPPVGNSSISDSESIYVSVGSSPTKSVTCGGDISNRTLEIVFETLTSTADLATISDANIGKSTVFASFVVPSSITSVERTLRANIRDTSNNESMASVLVFVTYGANGD